MNSAVAYREKSRWGRIRREPYMRGTKNYSTPCYPGVSVQWFIREWMSMSRDVQSPDRVGSTLLDPFRSVLAFPDCMCFMLHVMYVMYVMRLMYVMYEMHVMHVMHAMHTCNAYDACDICDACDVCDACDASITCDAMYI